MKYDVYRIGWNTENQPSSTDPHRMLVTTIEAESIDAAFEKAATEVQRFNNQRLEVVEQSD